MNEILKDTKTVQSVTDKTLQKVQEFEFRQRKAQLYAQSKIIPQTFQKNVADCYIVITMAEEMKVPEMIAFQHAYCIKGKVSWSAVFLIACFNSCGRFTPIQYAFSGSGKKLACQAFTTVRQSGKQLIGPTVSLEMAKAENWGAKWDNIPELMLRYRAASFLVKTVAPEIALGLSEATELEDEVASKAGQFKPEVLLALEPRDQSVDLAQSMLEVSNEMQNPEPIVDDDSSVIPHGETDPAKETVEQAEDLF